MIVLQLSPHDYQGGASRIAWYLHRGFKDKGIKSYLAVAQKSLTDPTILQIDQSKYQKFQNLSKILKWTQIMLGRENFNFPATRHYPGMLNQKPDLIHAHNLQGKYFDLRVLPDISKKIPFVLTLHDTWLLSGYCAYPIECTRWLTGCGKCPLLKANPSIKRDATAFNWQRKKAIFQQSRVYIATPSQWLLNQVEQSMFLPAVVTAKVIHNGVDTSIYKPANKLHIRRDLGLPEEAFILLYVVSSRLKQNPYKDYQTIDKALSLLAEQAPKDKKLIFLGLGDGADTEIIGNLEKRFIPYQNDTQLVARYYQAADILLHAARADTFPNVVLEALACGTPVIATAVGGICEQIDNGKTGYLALAQDPVNMCQMTLKLLQDEALRNDMAYTAVADVKRRFTIPRMVEEYLEYYDEILADFAANREKVFN